MFGGEHAKTREIVLGDAFGDVAVKVNGVRVEAHTDGSILVYTNGPVQVHPAANDAVESKAGATPEIGDEMEDGTILAGYYEGKPLYATPREATLTYTFNKAKEYAAKLDAHGHQDWRVPTKVELNVLHENRNKGRLKGTFNETGSCPAGLYWSSSPDGICVVWAQRFSDGDQYYHNTLHDLSLRCVRG